MKRFCSIIFFSTCILRVLALDPDVAVLRAVRGRDARLPCGQGILFLDGPDSYILWLKNENDFLYRFPYEDAAERAATRERMFGTLCDSDSCHDDTTLLVKQISDQGAGIYRCQVHYQASPPVEYVMDVRLVESPAAPRIYNEANETIKQSYVGPLSLGSNLTLICEVDDDQPDTVMYWRRNGAIMERAYNSSSGVLRAEVHVKNMTRDELDAYYECLVQNADVTEPLSASIVVRMHLPPISVEIRLNNNYDFEAGQPRVVDCVVVGCVPPPSVTWHLGENILRPSVHKEQHDGNFTVSSLTLSPSLRDNNRELVCQAHNSFLPNEVFEDKVTLTVGYRPSCQAFRDQSVGAIIREAETVTCVVEAFPEPTQFIWIFPDSRVVYTSVQKVPGHFNRYSSRLTWLPREGDFGFLLCRATNNFGEQKKPCAFSIVEGGPPHAPDCGMLRRFSRTVGLECQKGWDGGRPQSIHLELYKSDGSLLHNVSNAIGQFQLPYVEEDNNLTSIIYASNIRGRSTSRKMYLQTISSLSNSEAAKALRWERWLGAASGLFVMCVAVLATIIRIRYVKIKSERVQPPNIVPQVDGVLHRKPDVTREERVPGTTNITVNQLASSKKYCRKPLPLRRVLAGNLSPIHEIRPTGRQAIWV